MRKILPLLLSLLGLVSAQDIQKTDFTESTFDAKTDHFNYVDSSTYKQRYWMSDKYYEDPVNGPVFIYICGEYTCSFPEARKYPFMVGAQNKGLLMILEHRFYGKSQPMPDWSVKSLRLLNSEQALADLAGFIEGMNEMLMQKHGGGPRKWVVMGGSYPGALSAWFRYKYPHLAVASWSSSGVIQPVIDFWRFDQ